MTGASSAQVASTAFAAASAFAALTTVWLSRSQSRIAREALEADTQPLLTDAPRGLFLEEIDWHEASGKMTRRIEDRATIKVGNVGPEPVGFASVPIRNVGNGCARINTVVFRLADGREAGGRVDNPVLPAKELTHARIDAGPDDDGADVAESIGLEYQDFAVLLNYADVGGRLRGALRIDIANGQYPHVTVRRWADSLTQLR